MQTKRHTVPRGVLARCCTGRLGEDQGAHATKCAVPEDNQGRDEWMTVIEMQEYMRPSRSKAYDLMWSGGTDP